MADKLKSVPEVVQTIPSRSHIALGGFAITRNTVAVVHELMRRQKRDSTLSQSAVGLETDRLIGAGPVTRLMLGGEASIHRRGD